MATQRVNISDFEQNQDAASFKAVDVPVKTSFSVFILTVVEAVCVFYVAAAKSGFILLAAGIATGAWATFLHQDSIRIPVLLLVLVGAMLNLFLLWKANRLRNSPAAAWRKRALTKKERLRTALVASFSTLTLVLVVMEILFQRSLHHTLM